MLRVQDVQQLACAGLGVIMTGIGTVLADDPSLNLRLHGAKRQPLRVVVDSHWRTPGKPARWRLPGQVIIAGLE